uniref:Uncharacterized protein n=1 Tax=Anguilla anguilla TaxID=7936 RepID=A0A0E9X801_ANGAN
MVCLACVRDVQTRVSSSPPPLFPMSFLSSPDHNPVSSY